MWADGNRAMGLSGFIYIYIYLWLLWTIHIVLCLFSFSTLNAGSYCYLIVSRSWEVEHSGLYFSESHCKLPGFLFPLSPLMHCLIYFNSQGFFPFWFFFFFCRGHCLIPQKFAISQHYFLFGWQWLRMFLLSSPFTRETGNTKIPCSVFFLNWSKYALREVGIDLVSFFICVVIS